MTAIARVLSHVLVIINGVEPLKHFLMFCGAVLLVTMLMATYGLDLSPGFF
jgi:hypothetical protein